MLNSCPDKVISDLSCRSTKIRFGIISIFHSIKQPISAGEIIDELKNKHHITANKTTVYRQLDFLADKKIISSIDIDGSKHYQFNLNQSHQMMVCGHCHQIQPIKTDIKISTAMLKKISHNNHFKIKHYSLLFFGNCQKCQK